MHKKTTKLTIMALMAALSYVSFTFLQIKVPTPGGYTSFHLGNTFCLLGALLLGGLPGGFAAAIGMAIGDLLDPQYVLYVPKTLILKTGIGLVCGYMAHHVFIIRKKKGKELVRSVVFSAAAGMLFNIIGEPIVSYFYSMIVLQVPKSAASILASFNLLTTSVNAILSVIIASVLYIALYQRLIKAKLIKE